jgi:hypothetical protein
MNGVWKWIAGLLASVSLVLGGAAASASTRPSVSEGEVRVLVNQEVAEILVLLHELDNDIDALSNQQARLEERIIALTTQR